MRTKLLALVSLAAATAAGGVAIAQQAMVTYQAPMSRETNGGVAGIAQRTNQIAAGYATSGPQPVFAVIGHHVVTGDLKPGAPLLTLIDARDPRFACQPAHRGAEIVLACTDGSSAQLRLEDSGCGRSRSGEPASLCIGWTAKYAVRRLVAPPGESLSADGGRLTLKPAAG